jgi:hypothetical protein
MTNFIKLDLTISISSFYQQAFFLSLFCFFYNYTKLIFFTKIKANIYTKYHI